MDLTLAQRQFAFISKHRQDELPRGRIVVSLSGVTIAPERKQELLTKGGMERWLNITVGLPSVFSVGNTSSQVAE